MRERIYIFVNGILNIPGDAKDWNARAVTFTHLGYPAKAEKVEYFCGPIGRAFGQNRRARKVATLLDRYKGQFDIVLVGHSNGCDVILDALKMAGWPEILQLHLFSGACEADFQKNGLNDACDANKIKRIFVYVAGKDIWLQIAHTIPGKILGYGTLGLHGPLNESIAAALRTRLNKQLSFGHSSWWNWNQFKRSMGWILNAV